MSTLLLRYRLSSVFLRFLRLSCFIKSSLIKGFLFWTDQLLFISQFDALLDWNCISWRHCGVWNLYCWHVIFLFLFLSQCLHLSGCYWHIFLKLFSLLKSFCYFFLFILNFLLRSLFWFWWLFSKNYWLLCIFRLRFFVKWWT